MKAKLLGKTAGKRKISWLLLPKRAEAAQFEQWIGVDLDGTLALGLEDYSDPTLIGEPIPAMVEKVKAILAKSMNVKVFTARMADKENAEAIREAIGDWTEEHIGTRLDATNEKDPGCQVILDDKAKEIVKNTGEFKVAAKRKIAEGFTEDGFWASDGGGASGILPIAADTKRICLAWRSSEVHQGNCFGTIGGAVIKGKSPADSAKIELAQEVGYRGSVDLHPAFVFTSGSFQYHNFIGVVSHEFEFSPDGGQSGDLDHADETDFIEWLTLDEIQSQMHENADDFHPGLIKLFKESADLIEKLARGDKPKTAAVILKTASASPELGYLKEYMTMNKRQQAEEMAYSFPGSFAYFLREEDPELAAKLLPEDDDDYLDDLSKVPTPVLEAFLNSREVGQIMNNEPHFAPLFMHSDYRGDVDNEWLVHFTDNAESVASQGFTHGVEDFRQLGLTTYFKNESKASGGYNFAFRVDDINRHAYRRGRGGNSNYGSECVIFKAPGIKVFHYGDEEPQVIFWGKDARYIIPVHKEYDDWALPNGPETNEDGDPVPLYQSEDLEDVCAWVEAHYGEYKSYLTKKASKKAADRTSFTYGIDAELQSIVDKFEKQNLTVSISERDSIIKLDGIHLPKDSRSQGIGSAFMEELAVYADRTGKTIFLTPSTDFGGSSVARLRRFYGRFGFKRNMGRNKDFRAQEAMVRQPKASNGKTADNDKNPPGKPETKYPEYSNGWVTFNGQRPDTRESGDISKMIPETEIRKEAMPTQVWVITHNKG